MAAEGWVVGVGGGGGVGVGGEGGAFKLPFMIFVYFKSYNNHLRTEQNNLLCLLYAWLCKLPRYIILL